MRCKRCDAYITPKMVFCSQCGWIVIPDQARDEPVSAVVIPRKRRSGEPGKSKSKPGKKAAHIDVPFRQLESLASAIAPKRGARAAAKKARNQKTTPLNAQSTPTEVVSGWMYVVPSLVKSRCSDSANGELVQRNKSDITDTSKTKPCWAYALKLLFVEGPDKSTTYRPLRRIAGFTDWVSYELPDPTTPEAALEFARFGWQVIPMHLIPSGIGEPVVLSRIDLTSKKKAK